MVMLRLMDKTPKSSAPLTHPYVCTKCGTMGESISANDLGDKPFPVRYRSYCDMCLADREFVCLWQYHLEYYPVRFVSIPSKKRSK